MSKLENASGNLKEVLCAIADGKDVQYWASEYNKWFDLTVTNTEINIFDTEWLSYKWRIKPDAFEEWWEQKGKLSMSENYKVHVHVGWDAAMEHKDDE